MSALGRRAPALAVSLSRQRTVRLGEEVARWLVLVGGRESGLCPRMGLPARVSLACRPLEAPAASVRSRPLRVQGIPDAAPGLRGAVRRLAKVRETALSRKVSTVKPE